MNKITLILITMALIFILGCTQQVETSPSSAMPAPESEGVEEMIVAEESETKETIEIKNFAYNPSTITIKKGTTITWINQDSAPHTVTSDSGSELNSPTLSKNQAYSHTFNEAGTFTYYCAIHPRMKATVVVE